MTTYVAEYLDNKPATFNMFVNCSHTSYQSNGIIVINNRVYTINNLSAYFTSNITIHLTLGNELPIVSQNQNRDDGITNICSV